MNKHISNLISVPACTNNTGFLIDMDGVITVASA